MLLLLLPALAAPPIPLSDLCEQRALPRASELTDERRLLHGFALGENTVPDAPRLSLWSDEVPETLPETVLLPLDIQDEEPPGADVVHRLSAAHEAGARTMHLVMQRFPGLGLGHEIREEVAAGRPAWPAIEAEARQNIHKKLQDEVIELARALYEADTIVACKEAAKPATTFSWQVKKGASFGKAMREGHAAIDVVFEHAAVKTTDYLVVYEVRLDPTGTELVVTDTFDDDDVNRMVQTEGAIWLTALADEEIPVVPTSELKYKQPPRPRSPGPGTADCQTEVVYDGSGQALSASADCDAPFAEAAEAAAMASTIHPHEGGKVKTELMIRFRSQP